ncbi:hypothetical protein BAE44_0022934, partial [Dichanthelium oligosanthes]
LCSRCTPTPPTLQAATTRRPGRAATKTAAPAVTGRMAMLALTLRPRPRSRPACLSVPVHQLPRTSVAAPAAPIEVRNHLLMRLGLQINRAAFTAVQTSEPV